MLAAQRSTFYQIRDDNTGYTQDTLAHMRDITLDYVPSTRAPGVSMAQVAQLVNLAYNLRMSGDLDTLTKIFNYLKSRIRYQEDPEDREQVASAWQTIFNRHFGDCDDMSVAAATLLKILGFRVKFRAIAWRLPDKITHVYVVVMWNGKEIPFDLTAEEIGEYEDDTKRIEVNV